MADGIRINDAALEISPEGLEALVSQRGADVRVTRIDLSVSPEAMNTLLRRLAPEGEAPPTVSVSDGRLQVAGLREGKRMALDLALGGLRLELSADGLRLFNGAPTANVPTAGAPSTVASDPAVTDTAGI